jgi:hypothetical protein
MFPLVFAAALAAQASAPAAPAPQSMTCPIGGATFTYAPAARQTPTGERPDGKPYGAAVPALPECPDNGLVLYKEYEAADVAKLEPLVAGEAYQALRKEDTQYYRAYWLMREMDEAPARYLWALLQASWEAEGKPELRKRYLTELAEVSAKVEGKPSDLNWIGMEGRAINALRELGRFDEAAARLAKVPLKSLDQPMPAGAAATPEAVTRARWRRGWLAFFRGLGPVLARKDSSLEPLDLLPQRVAFDRCADQADALDEAGKAFCEKEAAAVQAFRTERDRLAKEMEALRRSREKSGR